MKRIRYVSRFARPLGLADIDDIIAASERNNPPMGITGSLVIAGELFFQMIEGPAESVDQLYVKIARDPRHDQILLLDSEVDDFERMCPDWAMARLDLSQGTSANLAPARALLEVVFAQRQILQDAMNALETFTWQGLLDAQLQAMLDNN